MKSQFSLKGKLAFVTGATRGIGWACAKTLAENGATVLINGHSNQEHLNSRVEELKKIYNSDSEGFLFDVSDYDSIKRCYAEIFKRHKKLDILVNNAGILEDNLIGMISQENVERILGVNTKSVIYNLQYASKLMIRSGAGSIINVSSIIGKYGNEGQVVYAASKAGVIGITYSAAKELGKHNIRVNAIAPGFINTDMIKKIPPEMYNARLNSIKMKRIGEPQDVANAVLFFASDLSEYVTGQILGVDGGMVI